MYERGIRSGDLLAVSLVPRGLKPWQKENLIAALKTLRHPKPATQSEFFSNLLDSGLESNVIPAL